MALFKSIVAMIQGGPPLRRAAPPPPSSPAPDPLRQLEYPVERSGLLWFPVLTVKDRAKLLVGVSSGLPHCVRCVSPLKLVSGRSEEWVCSGCGERHPGSAADLLATDFVLNDCMSEFFERNPDYSPMPGLSAPKREQKTAA